MEEYRRIVREMSDIEDDIMKDIQREVCQKFKIDIQVFRDSFKKMIKEDNKDFEEEMKE